MTATATTPDRPAAEWTPPPSPWVLQAKDIVCLRTLLARPDEAPMRIGMPTVLSIASGLSRGVLSREAAEHWLRDARPLVTTHASYRIDPDQYAAATYRTPGV